ncbi:protein kinase domain-containing protein [Rhodopirellula sallentina]|nr:protein kinase [Rhodopirellula sallentina]
MQSKARTLIGNLNTRRIPTSPFIAHVESSTEFTILLHRYLSDWLHAATNHRSRRDEAITESTVDDHSYVETQGGIQTQHTSVDTGGLTNAATGPLAFEIDGGFLSDEFQSESIRTLGRFDIIRLIGAGGMGRVYLAEDSLLKRKVAIKIPHQNLLLNRRALQRFHHEATSAAQLRHSNLIGVYDSGVASGTPFIAAEYVEGPSLSQWLKLQTSDIDLTEAAAMIESLADGMHSAHEQGILHRDLKPGNILLQLRNPNATAMPLDSLADYIGRITDFGLARVREQTGDLTETGCPVGSAGYASPEQSAALHERVSYPSDVFSLGVILYELLTRRRPFQRKTIGATHLALETVTPRRPRSIRREVPVDLDAICMKCLEKDIDKRYATAAHLRDDIRRFLNGQPTLARPVPMWEEFYRWSRRSPSTAALVFVCIALLVAGVWGLSLFSSHLLRHEAQLTEALERSNRQRARADRLLLVSQQAEEEAQRQEALARQTIYETDIQQAYRIYQQNRLPNARAILDKYPISGYPIDHRDFSWKWLNALLNARYRILGQHDGTGTEVAVSKSDKDIWSTSSDGVLKRFSFSLQRETERLDLDSGALDGLAITEDGSRIAVGVSNSKHGLNGVVIVSPDDLTVSHPIEGVPTTVESLAWSHDDRWLAIASRYGDTYIWESDKGIARTIYNGTRNIQVDFVGDTHQILVAKEESTSLQNVATGTPTVSITPGNTRTLFSLTADGKSLAMHHRGKTSILLGTLTNEWNPIGRLSGIDYTTESMACNAQMTRLAAGNGGGLVKTWVTPTGYASLPDRAQETPPMNSPSHADYLHNGPCMSLAYLDDEWLVSTGEDGKIVAYNATANIFRPITSLDLTIADFDCLQSGKQAILLDTNSQLILLERDDADLTQWTPTTIAADATEPYTTPSKRWRTLNTDKHHEDEEWVGISLDQSRAIACVDSGRVAIADLSSKKIIKQLSVGFTPSEDEWITSVALSPDGRLAAATCTNRRLHVWSVDDGKKVFEREFTDSAEVVSFSNDGRWLLVGGYYEQLEVFSTQDFHLKWSVDAGDGTCCGVFLNDNTTLITGHIDSSIRVWDIESQSQTAVLQGHNKAVFKLSISRDEKFLVSIDRDSNSRLWSLRKFHPIGDITAKSPNERILRARFSDDENQVLVMLNDEKNRQTVHAVRFDALP